MRLLEGRAGINSTTHSIPIRKAHSNRQNRGPTNPFFITFDHLISDRSRRKANALMWNRIKSQFTRGETSPSDTQQEENFQATASSSQKHLIILANGLFGSRHNWNYISEVLHEHLDTEITLIHVSKANEFTATYAGIDTCGHRLAAEINSIVVATPSLERISFIGHSMGGLIARYAAGELYNPQDQSIAGLKPTHYVSMATPHLGCEPRSTSPAQIPLVSWLKLPLAGTISPAISSTFYRRTGGQFFLNDSDNNTDTNNNSNNTNTSTSALNTVGLDPGHGHVARSLVDIMDATSPQELVLKEEIEEKVEIEKSNVTSSDNTSVPSTTSEYIQASLASLQKLQWRRIDCCFAGGKFPLLAHQHMQVQRKWVNYEGMATVKHLALQLAAMEEIIAGKSSSEKKKRSASTAPAAAPVEVARK